MFSPNRLKEMALEDIENNSEKYLEEYAELLTKLDQLKENNEELVKDISWQNKRLGELETALQEIKDYCIEMKKDHYWGMRMIRFSNEILQKCEVIKDANI